MSKEIYSYSGNFNSIILPDQLKEQIGKETKIEAKCKNIEIEEDNVIIYFDRKISEDEKKLLDNVINFHHTVFDTYDDDEESKSIYIVTNPIQFKEKTYQEIASFVYDGLISSYIIDKITLITKGDNYSIRLYDITNKKTLFEQNYTNKEYEENIIKSSNIKNIPEAKAIIELHVKIQNTNNNNIKYYNNYNNKGTIKLCQINIKSQT